MDRLPNSLLDVLAGGAVPDNVGLQGGLFYDCTTFEYAGYTDPETGVARQIYQRTFASNKGNTYDYPASRPVFSVRYVDFRPDQSLLGSTTDVVNWSTHHELSSVELAYGVRGLTFDLSNQAFANVGATFGSLLPRRPSS